MSFEWRAVEVSGASSSADSSSMYPDFKMHHHTKPDGCLHPRKIILSKTFSLPADMKREEVLCATWMLHVHFAFIRFLVSTLQECVYIWQEKKRAKIWVIECKRVPKACKEFYWAELDSAATAAKAKQSRQISAIKEAIHSASEASDSRKRKTAAQEGSVSTRI